MTADFAVTTAASRRLPRRLRIALQVTIVAAAVMFLVRPQLSGAAVSLPLLWDIDNGWIPAAIGAELASLLVYTLATRSLISAHRPSVGRLVRIDLSAIALGHCLPDGGAAGSALSWRLLTRAGVPSGDAMYVKVAQGTTATAVLQLLLLVGYTYSLVTDGASTLLFAAMLVPAAVAALLAGGYACTHHAAGRRTLLASVRGIPRYGGWLADRARRVYVHHIARYVENRQPRRTVALAAGWSAANWTLDAAALWAALHAFGAAPRLSGVMLAFGIATTVAWLPLSPSGVGVSEGLMIPALVAFGASRPDALLGVVTWRVAGYWLPMPLGALAYATLRWESWRHRAESGPGRRADRPR